MNDYEMPVVGDVLYSSWGYDQTNIDFYQVVRVSDKGSVWIVPMYKKYVESVGFMSDMVVPAAPIVEREVWENVGEPNDNGFYEQVKVMKPVVPSRHKWSKYGGISFNSYSGAWKWDGRPKNQTSYA